MECEIGGINLTRFHPLRIWLLQTFQRLPDIVLVGFVGFPFRDEKNTIRDAFFFAG